MLDLLIPAVIVLLVAHAWVRFAHRASPSWPSFARAPGGFIAMAGWLIGAAGILQTIATLVYAYFFDHHGHNNPTHYPQPGNPWPFWQLVVFQFALLVFAGAYLVRLGRRAQVAHVAAA